MFLGIAAVTALLLPGVALAATEQTHIALTGNAGEMGVSWVVTESCAGLATVRYGLSPTLLDSFAVATLSLFSTGMTTPICVYNAILGNLSTDTTYYYSAGDADTAVASFVSAPADGALHADGSALRFLVFADFGVTNDVSLPAMLAEAAAGDYDIVLHAGARGVARASSSSSVEEPEVGAARTRF